MKGNVSINSSIFFGDSCIVNVEIMSHVESDREHPEHRVEQICLSPPAFATQN